MLHIKTRLFKSHFKLALNHLRRSSSSNLTIFASGSVARGFREDSLQGDCLPKPYKWNLIHHQAPKKTKILNYMRSQTFIHYLQMFKCSNVTNFWRNFTTETISQHGPDHNIFTIRIGKHSTNSLNEDQIIPIYIYK